jgi:hypothetical protein
MKKTLIALLATAALAAPTAALAHDGHGSQWRHHDRGLFAKLTGTGTSFGGNTATASGTIAMGTLFDHGTFTASLATTWSSATTKTSDRGTVSRGTVSCAPATATLSVVGVAAADTVAGTLTGKTCAFTKADGTVVRAFFGRGTANAAGSLATLNGNAARLFLVQKADGTVKGAALAGASDTSALFVRGEREAKQKTGDCGNH